MEYPPLNKNSIDPESIRAALWPVVICVNIYDFLGLCHLVPTQTMHLSHPYLGTSSNFHIFPKSKGPTAYKPPIS